MAGSTLSALSSMLLEPAVPVADPERRRRARLLLGLSASLAPVALVSSTVIPSFLQADFEVAGNRGAQVGVAASLLLLVTWFLARQNRLEAAGWLLVAVAHGATWGAALLNLETDGTAPLFFLAATTIIASLLITPLATTLVACANLLALGLLPQLGLGLDGKAVTTPLIFLAIVATLVVVEAIIRRNHEAALDARRRDLAESENRYRHLFETSFEGLAVDADGIILDGNARFGPMFGYLDDEVNGLRISEFLAPGTPDLPAVAGTREVVARRKDGTPFPAAVVRQPCTHRGRPAFVSAWRDLTGTKAAERELDETRKRMAMSEKLSALGTLVAGVGHEINNPLAFMRGTVELHRDSLRELVTRQDLPADVKAELVELLENEEIVLRGIHRIDHITSSLKKVARAGNGQRSQENVNVLVQSVLTVAAPRLKGGVEVVQDLRAQRSVLANSGELSQVILNLVFNAADAMAGLSGARLVVRTADGEGVVRVEVEDNGRGILDEEQARIFTPFHTTKPEGTGLGLSTSWRIVEDHGGHLSFRSLPGRGTIFVVELPASVRMPAAPGLRTTGSAERGMKGGPTRRDVL